MTAHHSSSDHYERTLSQDFTNDPSMSFDEWRSARMNAKFGTDNLGVEYYPQGRGVIRERWTFTPVMVPSSLAFDKGLTSKEKLLCLTLYSASNAISYGGEAYRRLTDEDDLAQRFDMTLEELDNAVQRLHDMGYISIEGKGEVPDLNRRSVYEHLVEEVGYKYNYEKHLEAKSAQAQEEEPQPPKRASRSISSSMRLRVYKHDGYQCVVCKSNEDLVVDHIVPLAKGGTNARENLQTMCSPCNSSKGVKSMDEWMKGRS